MDSVPFAFCDTVASILTNMPSFEDASSSVRCPWKSAFADHQTNRMNLSLCVCFNGGKWSYYCVKSRPRIGHSTEVTFEEVQESLRKYIHMIFMQFSNDNFGSASSLDEIRSILKFLRPCVDPSAWLALYGIEAPREEIADLLSLFSSAPFERIAWCNYEEAFEDFLRKQIALETLKEFTVDEDFPPAAEFKSAFERIQRERSG